MADASGKWWAVGASGRRGHGHAWSRRGAVGVGKVATPEQFGERARGRQYGWTGPCVGACKRSVACKRNMGCNGRMDDGKLQYLSSREIAQTYRN